VGDDGVVLARWSKRRLIVAQFSITALGTALAVAFALAGVSGWVVGAVAVIGVAIAAPVGLALARSGCRI
jgi:hypothetical protein